MENIYKNVLRDLYTLVQAELIYQENLDDDKAKEIIAELVFEYMEDNFEKKTFSYSDIKKVIEKIYYKTRSNLNILKPLVDDARVTEIMVNGHDKVFFEKDGSIMQYEIDFDDDEEVEDVMQAIAGQVNREINELNPILDARLPDGSRVNAVYKNVAVTGPALTIRKFSKDAMSMEQLIENGTLSTSSAGLLGVLVACGYNIFISGATSTGKTTLINALGEYIGKEERVVVIEDSAELNLSMVKNLVQMECRNSNGYGKGKVTLSDLIKTCLRMRPDRLIVGEIRSSEVFDMLQAMNTGHSGMCTGHGNSIKGMLKRLETMYLMAVSIDTDAIRRQIAEGIDIMVHLERKNKTRKITEITEVIDYENGEFILNPLMEMTGGDLVPTGNPIINSNKIYHNGEGFINELRKMGFDVK